MHILIALTYYRPHYSGLTIYAERQARALVQRGHTVTILTSRFDKSLAAHEWCDGVEVVRPDVLFHISKGVIMPAMPLWAWRLVRRADVVNLHVPQFDAAMIALIARLLRKPVALTYHCDLYLPNGFINNIANLVSDVVNHVAARAADVIIHNTRDYAENSPFLRHYLHKLVPIYPPVEVESIDESERAAFRRKYNLLPGQRIIGMAARLATEKGVEYLVKALPAILERFPKARVLMFGPYQKVFGEEAYAERVMRAIEPFKEHWTFLGIISDSEKAVFFHECELVVLPSLNSTESYGIVQIEAMSCGTPVAASDLPGVRVPVGKTGAGLVVPRGDAAALAQAVITILEAPQRYRGQTEALVQLSTPEAVAEEYEKIFKRLVKPQYLKQTSRVSEVEGTRPDDGRE